MRDDLSSIPSQYLASLVSQVTSWIYVDNIKGCDLVSILDRVKSKDLSISNQRLGKEETQALVRAMETRVESVVLYDVDLAVALHCILRRFSEGFATLGNVSIEALESYSLQGKCCALKAYVHNYRDREFMRTLARRGNWKIVEDDPGYIKIMRT